MSNGKKIEALDAFRNFSAGFGDPTKDKRLGTHYARQRVNFRAIDALCSSSAMARRLSITIPQDATRSWRKWLGDHATELEALERRLNIRSSVYHAMVEANKFGGAVLLPVYRREPDYSMPLRLSDISKGDLVALTLVPREMVTTKTINMDISSPRFYRPEIVTIDPSAGDGETPLDIHHSQLIWLDGIETSSYSRGTTGEGWDDSFIELLRPQIEALDSISANIDALVFEARMQTLKVKNLSQYFENAEFEARFTERVAAMQTLMSSLRMRIIDEEEDLTTESFNFSGLLDCHNTALQTLSAASGIPKSRLLGESATGLGDSGKSDLRNYYDLVQAKQQHELATALRPLDEIMHRSVTGEPLPVEDHIEWVKLWEPELGDHAEAALKWTQSIANLYDTGLLDPDVLSAGVSGKLEEVLGIRHDDTGDFGPIVLAEPDDKTVE
ncbi:MAG: DUF1073 domain-containing protein [Rhizobiaceae bacterium]